MITEIATFSLLTPADLSDPSSPTTSIIRAFLSAILAADGGAHSAFFGQSAEKADTVVLFIDWDSAEAHRQFLASPAYAAIAAPLLELINPTTPVQILHVPAIPHALLGEQDDINVAEVVFFYFRSSLTAAETASVMATLGTLRPALEKSEAKGLCEKWAEEEGVEYVDSDGGEGGCKVLVSVVGWESLEAHLKMVEEEEEFGGSKGVIMGMEGLRGVEVFHVGLVRV